MPQPVLVVNLLPEVDVIEDDEFLSFINLVDYPVWSHSVLPKPLELSGQSQSQVRILCELFNPRPYSLHSSLGNTMELFEEYA